MHNITFITNSLGYGGASKILRFVAGELANRGHNISIINRNSLFRNSNKDMPFSSKIKYFSIKENTRLAEIKKIAESLGINPIIAKLLYNRGYTDTASVKSFIYMEKELLCNE